MAHQNPPVDGEVWEQVAGRFVGRRGRVIFINEIWVALAREPGTCPCPRKQRATTNLNRRTFAREWKRVGA